MVALRAVSRGVPVSHAMMTQFASLAPHAHLDEAVQTLLATGQGEFPVVDAAGTSAAGAGRWEQAVRPPEAPPSMATRATREMGSVRGTGSSGGTAGDRADDALRVPGPTARRMTGGGMDATTGRDRWQGAGVVVAARPTDRAARRLRREHSGRYCTTPLRNLASPLST